MSHWIAALSLSLCLASATAQAAMDSALTPTPKTSPKNSRTLFKLWARLTQPVPGNAQPIGTYAAGCLIGAVPVNADGTGYALMRRSRHRGFAHPQMLTYLQGLGERLKQEHLPLVLIGDISPARGGPMANGHNSHQIGLDADLWLRMSDKRPNRRQRETWTAPSFVINRKKLKSNWTTKQTQLVIAAADDPLVARVFVAPAIKRFFCTENPTAPWLYKIRAWWGHEEHIHVRLNCPPDAAAICQPQAALNPADNGCGSELDWWFSKEADDEWTEMVRHPKEREFPELPAACNALTEAKVNVATQ